MIEIYSETCIAQIHKQVCKKRPAKYLRDWAVVTPDISYEVLSSTRRQSWEIRSKQGKCKGSKEPACCVGGPRLFEKLPPAFTKRILPLNWLGASTNKRCGVFDKPKSNKSSPVPAVILDERAKRTTNTSYKWYLLFHQLKWTTEWVNFITKEEVWECLVCIIPLLP